MARQREETYFAVRSDGDPTPRCVVTGCAEPIVAEVHDDCYGDALEEFYGVHRPVIRTRRFGDRRIYVCSYHLEHDARMKLIGKFRRIANDMNTQTEQRLAAHRSELLREIRERTARVPSAALAGGGSAEVVETAGAIFVRSVEFQQWAASPGQRGRTTLPSHSQNPSP